MSDQAGQKQKAKGTKVTESIIGAASNKMVSATKALNDAVAQAVKLSSTMDENALKIADQEEKLTNLQTEYSNKRAQGKIDLDLAFKADQKTFVDKYLSENGLCSVPTDEYSELKLVNGEWETKFEEKVREETSRAYANAKRDSENEKKLLDAQYQAKEAQNLAEIKNLQSQLSFASQQAKQWETQLNAERQASVERAKAGAVGNINVTSPGR